MNLYYPASGCVSPYPGGLGDIISSHKWQTHRPAGQNWRTSPYQIKVWKFAGLVGENQELEGAKCLYDTNWSDEHFDFPAIDDSINDDVASLDMMYKATTAP
jgi:hypothetical protein